jgi:hypothetical protein
MIPFVAIFFRGHLVKINEGIHKGLGIEFSRMVQSVNKDERFKQKQLQSFVFCGFGYQVIAKNKFVRGAVDESCVFRQFLYLNGWVVVRFSYQMLGIIDVNAIQIRKGEELLNPIF